MHLDTRGPLWLRDTVPFLTASPQQASVAIRPIIPRFEMIAVTFVPLEFEKTAVLNGVPLWTGLHGVRQADRLDIGEHSVWLAAIRVVEPCAYDPATHGAGVYCTITKARLSPGESIVVCPGANRVACGAIYRQEAWEMVMAATPIMRCPQCKFHLNDAEWTPPAAPPKAQIRNLFKAVTHDCC